MANVLTDGNAEIKVSIYDVLSKTINSLLKSAADKLKGSLRRQFIAETVIELGAGGQSIAERELGWNRGTIRKGMHELVSGIKCVDAYNLRGRKKSEVRLKNLERDIRDIVEIKTQADATLHTTRQYVKMTVEEIRKQLIEQKNYKDEEIPKRRTINNVLKRLSLHLKKVLKNKPFKKIPKTDAIFDEVDKMNREADASEDILRLSMDAKATVKLGPFSRGGRNRNKIEAADHDFGGGSLTPFNILLPKYDELFISFAESKVTSDYIWDRLDDLWPEFRNKYNPSTLLLNLDNGPENSSRRTQFIKRAVDFANTNQVKVQLAYYPPYHSKYNPVERTHGALEQYWNGMLLLNAEIAIEIAKNMKWKGEHPVVTHITKIYEKGVKLTKKAMSVYEGVINRLEGLEDWFVEIVPCNTSI